MTHSRGPRWRRLVALSAIAAVAACQAPGVGVQPSPVPSQPATEARNIGGFGGPFTVCTPLPTVGRGAGMRFDFLMGLAVDARGAVVVLDQRGLHRVTAEGDVSDFANVGMNTLYGPIRLGPDGTVYAMPLKPAGVMAISPGGETRLVAGVSYEDNERHQRGWVDGPADKARFSSPRGLAFNAAGHLLVADSFNQRIREVTLDGTVTTIAGSGRPGNDGISPYDGPLATARFAYPSRVAVDKAGDLYVIDGFGGLTLRRVSTDGRVSTLYTAPSGEMLNRLTDVVVDAGDRVLFSRGDAVYRWNASGEPTRVATLQADPSGQSFREIRALAVGADRRVYAVDNDTLFRQEAPDATELSPLAGARPNCPSRPI